MRVYPSIAAYTADIIKAREAYYADQAVAEGFCASCQQRRREVNPSQRRCWTCRKEDAA